MMLEDKGVSLIEAVRKRGWNLYDSRFGRGEEAAIRALVNGPAEILEPGRKYVLMPTTENDKDPEEVYSALERVAVALDRQNPEISILGERHPLVGFRIFNDSIKIMTPMGHVVDYETAVKSAETLFNTKTMRYD